MLILKRCHSEINKRQKKMEHPLIWGPMFRASKCTIVTINEYGERRG